MRISRLALSHYGHFETQVLQLEARPGCINLVVAPNGAGKSVLRQAFSEMLFGIHPQTPMGFTYGYPKMRLQAEGERGGTSFGFIRRKGDANTVTDLAGQPADAALLGLLPRREDRKRLERLFILDSAQLRAGGRGLMQTDGDLADALLSGTGDLTSVRTLAAALAEQRDAAAPMRKKASAPFYVACDQWATAGQRLAGDAVTRPPQIAAQEARRAEAIQARAAANEAAALHAATLARLARIRATRQPLKTLDEAELWLAAHPDAPSLPAALGPALAAAEAAAADAAKTLSMLTDQHDAVRRDLAAQTVDDAVLAEAAAIEALTLESGRAAQSRADLPKRQAELAERHRSLVGLLGQLGAATDVAAARGVVRPDADIAAARAMILSANRIEAALAAATAESATLRQKIAEAEAEQAALPEPARTERIKALLAEATADGDPGRQARTALARTEQTQADLASALARVPLWDRGDAALLALAVPLETELTRLDEARRTSGSRLAQAEDALKTARDRVGSLRQQLAALTGTRPLPDAEAVAAARAHRDRGWRLIEARLAGQPGDEVAYESGAPLPLAYARAVAQADALADRRAEETERLATAAGLAREIALGRHSVDDAEARRVTDQQADRQAATEWAARMAMLGLAPEATIAEARGFLVAREAVITAAAARDLAVATQAQLAAQYTAWAVALAEAAGQPPTPLPLLVRLAQNQVAEADQAAARRGALAKTLLGEQRRLAAAQHTEDEAAAAQSAWLAQWQTMLARIGRPADETPDATSTVLDALVALRAETHAAATLEARLAEMTAQLSRFAQDAGAIGARLGLAPQDPAQLAADLAGRLSHATAQRARRQTLQEQADTTQTTLLAAQRRAQTAQAALRAAIAATGAPDLPTAQIRVAQAAERAAQDAARAAAQRLLDEAGQGLPVATLRAESAGLTPDELAAQETLTQAKALEAQGQAQEAAAAAQAIATELAQLTTRHDAAEAALDRQAAAAQIGRVLDDALVQHLAAMMLEQALAVLEQQGGTNAKLVRIGAVFSALTGGAYDGVSPAEESKPSEEHGRLQAHEAGGGMKHIAQLSEGTRDQLYLALRIVAIEDHVAAGPPLPFLADDILQTFDDTRALAALNALLTLSQHTQIIVLTHHPHLAALAGTMPSGSVHLAAL